MQKMAPPPHVGRFRTRFPRGCQARRPVGRAGARHLRRTRLARTLSTRTFPVGGGVGENFEIRNSEFRIRFVLLA